MAGIFAVLGLLLLALHLAKPDLLRNLVDADLRLWSFTPWVAEEWLDPEGDYQRTYRRVAVIGLAGWTVVNLALFALSYAGVPWVI